MCPCCGGYFRKMKPYKAFFYLKGKLTDYYTENAICPGCGSDIRHRFLLSFLVNKTNVLNKLTKILYFAPETFIRDFLKKQKNVECVLCDIVPSCYPGAIKVDMTDIKFSDDSFDGFIASHVLEHIKDDVRAVKEVYRVVRPGGWALIVIPIYGEETFEDAGLDYNGREKMYGIGEHMRMNGLDFKIKLANAGFSVNVYSLNDVPGNYIDRNVNSVHVESDKYLFFCKK